jgi:acetyl-CoA carboxylase carboxyltransferase component
VEGGAVAAAAAVDPDHIRADLQEVIDRHAYTLDENRPEAVAKRHKLGNRMPRENIAELADAGSFKEYWPLVVALQHDRHDMETLRRQTPADGLIAGMCTINGDIVAPERARAMIVHYDYTVLAGTQGRRNHYKQDRMFELAHRARIPVVLFGEGGGGRPGDDDNGPRVAVDTTTFTTFSKLSGLVPLVGVVNGRCFAGNTALVACCDVIIATENTTLAMGGPAMIEGGGLGIYTPEEVGPMSFQVPNGVVDILVKDEAAAVAMAKKYLSYFQGAVKEWQAPDQRLLRHIVPENRLRLYDMREIIHTLADKGSVLELREKFGIGIITAFIRVEGRPMGVIANNPYHLAGAIDSDGADKAARFLRLCDAFDIPVLSLMDCPGMMVGPDVERTALVRHCVRLFNTGANMTVPFFGVVVRKAYGLGVQAMMGAGSLVGFFTVAWPTAEFAGMNIEGAVKLGYRKELAAIEDPEARRAEFDRRVAEAYETAKAVNASVGGGVDDVIDPAETRAWIVMGLRSQPPVEPRTEKKHAYIDTW